MPTPLRRSLAIPAIAALVVCLAAVGGYAVLQTAPGQAWLAAALSRWISTPEMRVTIQGLDGSVPFDVRVPRIELADERGTWLTIEDAELAIAPYALFARRFEVRRLAARSLVVLRAPAAREAAEPGPSEMPSIPRLPVDIAVDTLRVDEIRLAADVLGEPLTATLAASGRIENGSLAADLELRRTDDTPGRANLSIGLPRDGQLALVAEVVEPTGRVAQRLLGTNQPAPFTLTARGTGAPESWHGTLSARAGELARLDAEIALERRETWRVTTKGELDAGGLRPAQLAPLVPQAISFALAATVDGNIVTVERVDLASGALSLEGRGRYDTGTARVSGEATAHIPDLVPLGAAVATPLDGSAEVHVALEGSADRPRARLTLEARNVRSGEIAAGHVSAHADLDSDRQSWRLAASGALEEIAIPGIEIPAPPEFEWEFRASADPGFARIDIEHLRAAGAGIAVAGSGRAAPPGRIDGTLRIDVADLAALGALAGLPLQGSLGLNAGVESTGETMTMRLRGETGALGTGIAAVDALLGPRATLAAQLSRGADGAIAISAARIDGAHVGLAAQASIPGDFARIDGTARLDLPRLAPLGEAIGTPLAGSIGADAAFAGALASPSIKVDAAGTGMDIAGWRFDRIATGLTLAGPAARDGRIEATFATGSFEGRADASFTRPSPERLSLSGLSISAPATTFEGTLDIAFDVPRVSGTIEGKVADLAPWSALAGSPLAGQADMQIKLAAEGGQRAAIRAGGRGLRLGETAVADLRLEADLAGLLGALSGRASLTAADVAAPGLRLETARLSARSSKPGVFAVNLQGAGALSPDSDPSPIRVAADGEISIGTERRLRVTRLAGRLGAYDIASTTPLVVTSGARGIRLDGLDWRVGEGRLTASGARAGERIELAMQARSLPLGLVRSVAPGAAVDGALDASLALTGTTRHPAGRLEASLRELRLRAGDADVPPLAALLRADWKNGVVALDGRLDGPGGTGLDISGALPLVADPQTAMPAMPRDGAIRLAARGDGLLESWAAALPIGEDRLAGHYVIDVQIRGTVAAPEAAGHLTLANGRYVSFAAGTELRNLELELAGDGRKFVLRRLQATDAAEGTLRASGAIDLAGASGPAVDLTAQFKDFQAVRRDEATATADGALRLQGAVDAATLSGSVRVERAEIRIPERLPPHIARFDVIEINSERNVVLSAPEPEEPQSAVQLDLQVEIPARAFVRGRGLDSEWRGSLRVSGSVDRPAITGSLSVVRGDFALLGKSFALSEGSITFLGEPEINPQLNFVAEHRAAEITARAIITGTVTSPAIALSSQPELPQDEVLARVLFGRSLGQITPAQGLQLAQAAASLAGGGPGILDRLRTAVGLDRLDVSAGADSASGEPGGPTVSGGKYVTDRVFVGVEQGATSQSTRTKVEIELTPNVTVESSVGANAAAGVGVNWRWDY